MAASDLRAFDAILAELYPETYFRPLPEFLLPQHWLVEVIANLVEAQHPGTFRREVRWRA